MIQIAARRPRRPVDGILLLDKPAGLSSNEALQQVKRLYRAEKAGHTGSLDPLATGLLPICLGQATKLCGLLLEGDKRYRAVVRVGERTTTGDAEGEAVDRSDASSLTEADWVAAVAAFIGPIRQVPPMYSALKREGRPLYELAREGREVERASREVVIRELRLLNFTPEQIEIEVLCSKGTYIRTLAEDLARSLGQCAHLRALRRLGAAPFFDPVLVPLERIEALSRENDDLKRLDALLLPAVAGVADWPRWSAGPDAAQRLSHGAAVQGPPGLSPGRLAVTAPDGRLLGLAEVRTGGRVAPLRWMAAAGTLGHL